jgi:murein DD-endopeptidase MepM/ murein hydrolase activator NlpD
MLILLVFLAGCSVSKNPLRKEVKLLQKGIIKDDTSYVYALPYEEGKSYRLMQGYFGPFTHKERAALDFNLKRGTKVCAAREGVVVRVKEDGDRGGWNRKYRPYGNNVVIQHSDGSRSGYWHLQHNGVLVNVGDTVKKGQVIALNGKTGYTSMLLFIL